MKNTRKRSISLSLLVLLFVVGLATFTFKLIINANDWALSPFNKHLSGVALNSSGKVIDRNEVVLLQSINGKRVYNSDLGVRKSLLHTLGDGSSHISTAIPNLYRAELYGYNFITGANCPHFLNSCKDIKLTLDSELCKLALEKLGSAKGAVAVYNYKTGEILCLVSTPCYDPNNPPIISDNLSTNAGDNYDGVYINRVMSATYTPGSIFKLITSVCAIDNFGEKLEDKVFNCQGKEKVSGGDITCLSSHGNIKFKNALTRSCNIYFANLAMELGKEKMLHTAQSLGFNKSFNINKIQTKQSSYEAAEANDYNLGWSGVGQYKDLVNPMHMLILMGAIANKGKAVIPRMIGNIISESSVDLFTGNYDKVETEELMPEKTAEILKSAMRYTVQNNYGDSMFKGLAVCAKTGTAEVGENKLPHAWMVGFSSEEKTPLAFVVISENSGFGIRAAAPIAQSVLQKAANVITKSK
ncbi:MAG: penicillin-binding protein [Clostridia bacterium]|nr:penicillin-binding protein [Clostridia bacterium]